MNASILGEDSRSNVTPIFCYGIRHLDADEAFFLCNWPEPIEIEGLPASWGAADPQEFLPAQINHGQVERRDGIDKVTFDVEMRMAQAAGLSRYTLFGAIPKIRIDVVRISPGPVNAGIPAVWNQDTTITQSGHIDIFTVEGHILKARCAPEPFLSGHQVPRWRFTRTCNRQLYGVGCGVDPAGFILSGNILSMDYTSRSLVISGQRPALDPEDFFRQGVLVHTSTGTRHSIFTSAHEGLNTRVWLHQWFPDFEVTDTVSAFAGCRHTIDDCHVKFDNRINFGGFPLVPSENPAIHGVRA